jgi:hypothetical protein
MRDRPGARVPRERAPSAGGDLAEEHRRLVASVDVATALREDELVAQDDAARARPRPRLPGQRIERRPEILERAEARPVDAVAEADPAFVSAAAVEEPGVHAAEARRDHDQIRSGDVCGMRGARTRVTRHRQPARRLEPRLDRARPPVQARDLVDDETYLLREGDPMGERLARVAEEKGILLMMCDSCALERGLAEGESWPSRSGPRGTVRGVKVGCFPDLYAALAGSPAGHVITL